MPNVTFWSSDLLFKSNGSHHRFAKRQPTHPTLNLPAEANPGAWHCWVAQTRQLAKLATGSGLPRLSGTKCSGRACTTGFPSRKHLLWFSKMATFRKALKKTFGNSDRNPTAAITGERRPTNWPTLMNPADASPCAWPGWGAIPKQTQPTSLRSDGIVVSTIGRAQRVRRACATGFPSRRTSSLTTNGHSETVNSFYVKDLRGPTAGITGEASTTQPASRPMNRAG